MEKKLSACSKTILPAYNKQNNKYKMFFLLLAEADHDAMNELNIMT